MQIGVGTKDQRGEASLAAEEQIRGCHPPALSRVSYLGQCSQYNNLDHKSRGSGSQISNNLVNLKNLESSNKQPIKFWHDDHIDNDHPIPASPPWTLSSGLLADQFSNMSTKTGKTMGHLKTVKSVLSVRFETSIKSKMMVTARELSPQIYLLERGRSRLEHRQAGVPHIRQPLAQVRTDRHSQDHLSFTSLQEWAGHGGAMARNLGRRRGRLLFHSWQCALPGLCLGSVASFSINLYLFIVIGPHESFPIRSFWGVE